MCYKQITGVWRCHSSVFFCQRLYPKRSVIYRNTPV